MIEDAIKVFLLALVEGIAEFLPISSTGHLIVVKALLNFDAMGIVFEILIQIGAVIAVILYYRQTLLGHCRAVRSSRASRRFWLLLVLASLPAWTIGFLFERQIGAALYSPQVVALSLIAGGIVLLLVERLPRFRQTPLAEDPQVITDLTIKQALFIGSVQALALVPGRIPFRQLDRRGHARWIEPAIGDRILVLSGDSAVGRRDAVQVSDCAGFARRRSVGNPGPRGATVRRICLAGD